MRTVIVPNALRDEINARLDRAAEEHPEMTPDDRDHLYHEVLRFVDEHGYVPTFSIANREERHGS